MEGDESTSPAATGAWSEDSLPRLLDGWPTLVRPGGAIASNVREVDGRLVRKLRTKRPFGGKATDLAARFASPNHIQRR
jgi:hypothetical protein